MNLDDSDQWPYYEHCVKACQNRGIYQVSDLEGLIVTESSYQAHWLDYGKALSEKNM
ncbi:histone acetyltransferase [Streptococcus ictaluri]|uniref:Uncharacterized protein n=1 Tax=Streptococcus ictaluri 707-05 TaxID=764299 RepID=G5K187_9STRE|nr:hypothetical protein [Streptococcus ictaluri]EHI70436.1 hypothetical protein STRIC_0364 [Streptococcus ictaluri 707-05]